MVRCSSYFLSLTRTKEELLMVCPFETFKFAAVRRFQLLFCDSNYRVDFLSVVNQFYKAEILTEYVIRGNTAVLKCSIPSFVADFVRVEAWLDDEGSALKVSDDYGNF